MKHPEWIDARDDLIGTCKSKIHYEELFADQEFCLWLDQHIFLCTVCGWWCEISEEASTDWGLDEWTCGQCCMEGIEANNPYTNCSAVEGEHGWCVLSRYWKVGAASEADARRLVEVINGAYRAGQSDKAGEICAALGLHDEMEG